MIKFDWFNEEVEVSSTISRIWRHEWVATAKPYLSTLAKVNAYGT
jgi:hypothetical protein